MDKQIASVYTQWSTTGHQKEGNNAICSNMGGPRDCHTSEIRQKEKGKYRMRSVTSVITT